MQLFETEGKIIDRGETSNKSKRKNGEVVELGFYKRECVLEIDNSFNDKTMVNYLQLDVVGDKCKKLNDIDEGSTVKVKWWIAGNKSQDGRVFNKARLVDIEQLSKKEENVYDGDQGQGFGYDNDPDDLPF